MARGASRNECSEMSITRKKPARSYGVAKELHKAMAKEAARGASSRIH
jgi:hypothetical protein